MVRSSTGRASVSKADGCRFESCRISPHRGWCAAGVQVGTRQSTRPHPAKGSKEPVDVTPLL